MEALPSTIQDGVGAFYPAYGSIINLKLIIGDDILDGFAGSAGDPPAKWGQPPNSKKPNLVAVPVPRVFGQPIINHVPFESSTSYMS